MQFADVFEFIFPPLMQTVAYFLYVLFNKRLCSGIAWSFARLNGLVTESPLLKMLIL